MFLVQLRMQITWRVVYHRTGYGTISGKSGQIISGVVDQIYFYPFQNLKALERLKSLYGIIPEDLFAYIVKSNKQNLYVLFGRFFRGNYKGKQKI